MKKMNKLLLILIIVSGFLVIFYANSNIFNRKTIFGVFQKDTSLTSSASALLEKSVTIETAAQIATDNNVLIIADRNHHRKNNNNKRYNRNNNNNITIPDIRKVKYIPNKNASNEYNIFVIYTKENYQLQKKFELFAKSLLKYTSIKIHLHIITDNKSEISAEEILKEQINRYKKSMYYTLYDVHDCAEKISDIVHAMMPYFSSNPGSYYSDALFYLSLGLHRIVDPNMERAILIDCDVVFRTDVRLLFDEFNKFSSDNLFGLAPELTPVYRHILYRYRANNPTTNFGNPYYPNAILYTSMIGNNNNDINNNHIHLINNLNNNIKHNKHLKHIKHGYPGLNSGVVMLHLKRIRSSKLYYENLKEFYVRKIVNKYSFKGHLGDQDYYTLLGYEFPSLIYRLDCVWNRQLCTWWKDHGYSDVFDTYFHCEGKVKLYHGNCNTRVPE